MSSSQALAQSASANPKSMLTDLSVIAHCSLFFLSFKIVGGESNAQSPCVNCCELWTVTKSSEGATP